MSMMYNENSMGMDSIGYGCIPQGLGLFVREEFLTCIYRSLSCREVHTNTLRHKEIHCLSRHWLSVKILGLINGNISLNTSRKLCEKESHSFSHCDSFDHPNLQALNDCIFVSSVYPLKCQEFWGLLYTVEKVLKKLFQKVYYTPPKTVKIPIAKPKKTQKKQKICNRLMTTCQGGQKNRNGKMIAVIFSHTFLLM